MTESYQQAYDAGQRGKKFTPGEISGNDHERGWEGRRMPVRTCRTCGRSFQQGRGRPSEYCPEHRRAGGRYGGDHKKRRAATIGQAWGSACTRCGKVIEYGSEIHLDHLDGGGPADYRGWSHAACNTGAAARKGNRMRAALNGRRVQAPVPEAAKVPPPVPKGPDPSIRHAADCSCGGSVFYPGPGGFWTSRCW